MHKPSGAGFPSLDGVMRAPGDPGRRENLALGEA